MPSKTLMLLSKLKQDYPQFTFTLDEVFRWSPSENTIYHTNDVNHLPELLHELSHAILGHKAYQQDIELLQMEREAWEYAQKELSLIYNATIDDESIEKALDTYRNWLHTRSICPECDSNGIHTKTDTYKCLACGCQWRANDARMCELRRFKL